MTASDSSVPATADTGTTDAGTTDAETLDTTDGVFQRKRPRPGLTFLAKRKEVDEEWMLTYMDTVTLLVTLFALLLSTSSVDEEKYQALAEGLSLEKYGAGILTGSLSVEEKLTEKEGEPQLAPASNEAPPPVPDTDDEKIRRELSRQGLTDLVEISVQKNVIDLQLNEIVLFQTGEAILLDKGLSVVSRLAPILMGMGHSLSVEGHTDNIPISTSHFPSNWELSAARAASVARELIRAGLSPSKVHIRGYADTRPIADNRRPEGRYKNRRVNLILKASGDKGDAASGQ